MDGPWKTVLFQEVWVQFVWVWSNVPFWEGAVDGDMISYCSNLLTFVASIGKYWPLPKQKQQKTAKGEPMPFVLSLLVGGFNPFETY